MRPIVGLVIASAGVVVLAGILRLWALETTPFGIDEAALVRLAEDMVKGGRVPLSGPITSIGIASAPHFIYAIAPVVAISREPAFVAGAIAVANVMAVLGTLWIGWRWFGPAGGIIAALLFATSPWAVAAGRWIWQPNLLPPLAVLLCICLDRGVVERRAWWSGASLPVLTFGSLVHPAFALLSPLVLAAAASLILGRKLVPLIVGVAISLAIAGPFVLHQVQTRWIDYANYRYYASLHTFVDLDALRSALIVSSGLLESPGPSVPVRNAVASNGAAVAESLLLALGICLAIFSLVRAPKTGLPSKLRVRVAGMLLWLALPIALTIRHTFPIQPHYLLAIYPAPFVLIGGINAWLGSRVRLKLGLVLVTLSIGVIQAGAMLASIQHLRAAPDDCYGTTLATASDVAHDVRLFARASNAVHGVVELNAADALPTAYLMRGALPAVDLAGSGAIGLGDPVSVVDASPKMLTQYGPAILHYANGVQLIDTRYAPRADPGQRLHFAITWSVGPDAPPNRPLVWRVIMTSADGEVVFDQSGMDHVPAASAPGPLVSWFSVDAPQLKDAPLAPGDYTLTVQLQDAYDSAAVPFGASGDTSWSLGPLPVPPRQGCRAAFTGP